jgi:hypothetical protein
MNNYIYAVIGIFVVIGVFTVVDWVITFYRRTTDTLDDLTKTLKDAAEVARAYREDVRILKQIAQSSPAQNYGQSELPGGPQQRAEVPEMPAPYWGRYPIKPEEPDAALFGSREIDVTPSDEEIVKQEEDSDSLFQSVLEKQKEETRKADIQRTKLSGETN